MGVEITCLPNGLNVLTHAMPHIETVALGIWVKAGARDERPEENGIAHFLEHMAFKGTKRRTAKEIAEEIESAGGEINASTGMETTTYYARVLKDDWALALDILADIFTESALDDEELERERDVILQEIAAANDQPDDLVFDLAQSASLRRPSPGPLDPWHLGTDRRRGPRKNAGLAQPELLGLAHCRGRRRQYRSRKICRSCRKAFWKIERGQQPQREPPSFSGTEQKAQKPLDQTHVVLSFAAPGYRDPEIYQLQVLSSILGGGMSSQAVPGGPREARALLQRLRLWLGL